jgi:glycosyltransferase involved in cell wall biosynthesis
VLSVIMPVYNERATLRAILEQVLGSPWVGQLVIVDDCSKDGTVDLLKQEVQGSDERIHVVFHEVNQGKGAAIRTAQKHLTHPFTIIQDADLEYDPDEYGRLLEPLLAGHADVVYGSRFRGEVRRVLFFWHTLGNQFLTLLSNACTNLNLTDMETCYKVFNTELFQSLPLRSQRFGFEPEVTNKLARLGLRLYEVPISYHGRTYAEGKKIGWRDGINAIYVILREKLFGARLDMDKGHIALHRLSALRKYHSFLWTQVEKDAGQKVVEVGAGIGNIAPLLLNREHVWLADYSETYLRHLRARWGNRPNVTIEKLDMDKPLADDNAANLRGVADTVVAFNVVEHIEDDLGALRTIRELLEDDGKLLLLVPYGPRLYGKMDEELDHFRRYKRDDLKALLEKAGFEVERVSFANALGTFGWWFNGRVLRRRRVPNFQARLNQFMLPLLRLERRLGIPYGLSIIMIARRVPEQVNPAD